MAGASWIEPYRHPLLEQGVVTDGQSSFLVVRERMRSGNSLTDSEITVVDAVTYRLLLAETLAWPLEFLLAECKPDGSFRLTSGLWGTAPLYLTMENSALRGSWSLSDLRAQVCLDQLDDHAVARTLAQRHRYTRDTLFQGIYQFTERAHAVYSYNGGLRLRYPEDAQHARPRSVREGVDVIEVYQQCLEHAVTERIYDSTRSAVELSGGMDSANVAMTLAALHHGQLLAYALMIGNHAGAQQSRRRAELLNYCRFRDLRMQALDWPPLHPSGMRARGEIVDPLAEPYHEAVIQIMGQARRSGVQTVFTGDGGDELVSLRGSEWAAVGKIPGRYAANRTLPPWLGQRTRDAIDSIDESAAPASVINEATLLGFACRSPQFLAAGLWPVSPLCSPRLIRFAEQLPVEWRNNKRICRARLARLGFSDDVVNPVLRENFTHVMEYGLRRYGEPLLATFKDDSILVDLGYIDGQQLRAAHDRLATGEPVERLLFQFLALELGLRAMSR